MLNYNNSSAFAIRFNNNLVANASDKSEFQAMLQDIADKYPTVKIEGITSPRRQGEEVVSGILSALGICRGGVSKGREILTVGMSEKFDISFEAEKDVILGGYFPSVPVYDIVKDKAIIMKKLAHYLHTEFPASTERWMRGQQGLENLVNLLLGKAVVAAKKPEIKYFSEYVQVGSSCLSWSEFKRTPYYCGR